MAHFAKLDDNNVVLEVIVVHNNEVPDEAAGIKFLMDFIPHSNWKQCSYNGNFRGVFPGIGYRYDAGQDVFIAPEESHD